jgi:hypothetical protein
MILCATTMLFLRAGTLIGADYDIRCSKVLRIAYLVQPIAMYAVPGS